MCGLGRILGYIGGRPSVGATMSQSGSGEPPNGGTQGECSSQLLETTQLQHSEIPNQNGVKTHDKSDLSNGFENRSVVEHQERLILERNQTSLPPPVSRPQQHYPQNAEVASTQDYSTSQTGMYPTLTRRQSTMGQSDDRHSLTGQVTIQSYQPEKTSMDRVAYVSQTATQTLPVQSQPQFVSDYVPDPSQYPQSRGQFEVRSQLYTQPVGQYGDRVGYVTRDVTYRDSALYAHTQSATNPIYTGASGGYVTVQHAPQLPSQSTSPQPPFYSGVIMTSQPPQSATPNYGQFTGPHQYSYSQYPQTVMNPLPYNPHTAIYPPQQFSSQQTSPNPQRYSQEMTQYQGQPIIQPIAQNVIAPTDRSAPGRGPKPTVPPRVNSKITCDAGHRKSASVDVPGSKTNIIPPKYETNQNVVTSQEGTLTIAASGIVSGPDARSFLTPLNQTPRTRQDGLYVDSNDDQTTRDKIVDTIASECPLYVSRSEHRKSISVDVTTSFPRRNDTITFTFPGDNSDVSLAGRKTPANLADKKWSENNTSQVFVNDQRRVVEPVLRVSSMPFDGRQEIRKSVVPERKPECCNISPNQRTVIPQENRRSDYFEEHRRSPMPMDPKRIDEFRRSPMPFMPVRDTSMDRAQQKSPSMANQNFEKTRQELAVWAEHRQRHEIDRAIHHQVPVFTTSPRSRNQSEERRDPRVAFPIDEQQRIKDTRVSQAAFQPIPNISQNTIMEQRRHLRHVSADLTKHMELSRKDFDDQPTSGSVANLVPPLSTASSQRASPNLCHQFPALSEAKLDAKTLLTVVTDFSENPVKPSFEQSDHIIHSHKKSHNISANLITHSKSQAENLQAAQNEMQNEKNDTNQTQHQQMHNQQSLDIISEKLSQFERQQTDLQARLQCLQNQNQFLDQVAQFQHQQSDLQARLQCLQDRQATEKTLRQATEFQPKNILPDIHQIQLNTHNEHPPAEQSSDKLAMDHQHSHRHSNNAYPPSATFQNQICQSSLASDRLSPRIQHESSESERSSQILMALPSNSPFERSDGARGSLQYRLVCQADMPESIGVPSSSSGLAASVTSSTTNVSVSGVTFSGTLKKVPPEKPPRTSLIVQSPEAEVNEQSTTMRHNTIACICIMYMPVYVYMYVCMHAWVCDKAKIVSTCGFI